MFEGADKIAAAKPAADEHGLRRVGWSELAAAISDAEQRIAKLERGSGRVLRPYAVKDL